MAFSRKKFILDLLAFRCRVISRRQFLSLGPPSKANGRNSRRLLSHPQRSGLIKRLVVLARPAPVIDGPIATWQPGESEPDFHAVQYRAQKRLVQAVEAVTVFVGTDRLANAVGGSCGGKFNHHSVSHDLGVTAVFLYLWRTDPNLALAWQGEDVVASSRKGQKLPDAILFNASGEPSLVIEFIGDYPVERIRAFHVDCAKRNLPYEVY